MDTAPARSTATRRPAAVQRVHDPPTRVKIVAAAALGLVPAAVLAVLLLTGRTPSPAAVVVLVAAGALVAVAWAAAWRTRATSPRRCPTAT